MSTIRITAFKWVPPFAQGLVRDLRVRWALEEAGLRYEEKLLGPGEQNSPQHRAVQPFGQVPVYEEEGLTLFESGAIVLHVGERSSTLLPADPARRARARTWVFAALNSIEPHVLTLTALDHFYANEEWAKGRRPSAEKMAQSRLDQLAAALGTREYLEGEFTAGDLVMTTVLRFLRHTDRVRNMPTLAAYQARCEARPAFQRALASQLAHFAKHAPATAA
ncbi:MAG TPA: glutathione S-transferase family protein [Steroidobacteraceae bacterium]|nr:glutathione S-transferase family protein [Steroidobacteraceae bacterium]